MGTITTQILMNPFLVFGVPVVASTILLSGAITSVYLLEDGTSKYLLEDGTSNYLLEGGGDREVGDIVLISPGGDKILRSE